MGGDWTGLCLGVTFGNKSELKQFFCTKEEKHENAEFPFLPGGEINVVFNDLYSEVLIIIKAFTIKHIDTMIPSPHTHAHI